MITQISFLGKTFSTVIALKLFWFIAFVSDVGCSTTLVLIASTAVFANEDRFDIIEEIT